MTATPGSNHSVALAWPTNNASSFVLKQTGSLAPPVHWATVTNAPVNANGSFVVTLPSGVGTTFFALSFE